MKILHTVEFYHPHVGGAQEVVRRVSEGLAGRGHDVTVATTRLPERHEHVVNGVRIAEFDVRGNAVRGIEGEASRYQAFLRAGEFDVMMNYAAQNWTTDLAFEVVDQLSFPSVLVPCGFSALGHPAFAEYFTAMPEVMRRYARIILHGNGYRDAAFARQHGITHTSVVPNGAAQAEFLVTHDSFRARHGIPPARFLVLSVGSHTGEKGHREAMLAFRRARIGPATLVIIGNEVGGASCLADCRREARRTRLLSLGRKQVLLLNLPRAQVVEAYHDADLFLFPSNIECSPIVLFEAIAAKTPFIATACGNAEEIVEWTGGGRIVPTTRFENGHVRCDVGELARLIESLAGDPAERQRLAAAGHAAWQQRFQWEQIVGEYERVYRSVSDRAAAAS